MSPEQIMAASLWDLAKAIRHKTVSSVQIMQTYADRIQAREPDIGAWEVLDLEQAMAWAEQCDNTAPRGVLHGIPIGVKDTIDTLGLPTGRGSSIYRGHFVPWDAACVTQLKRAGAIIPGKTVSTEFAYFSPGKTANPVNIAHTPGGSSSGSAAAVADGMLPAALGSQTAGSLIRPASYCGIVGYKPSFGEFSLAGVKPLAHSLDTLGVLVKTVADAALLRQVLLGHQGLPELIPLQRPIRIALCREPAWMEADASTRAGLAATAERLALAHAQVQELILPESCNTLLDAQRCVMAYEAAHNLAFEYETQAEQLSTQLIELIEQGRAIRQEAYLDALKQAQGARQDLRPVFEQWDLLLTPAATGAAPLGLSATGDPVFSRMWTLLGLPCISLPVLQAPNGLPVGVQLVGALGHDPQFLRNAAWVEAALSA